MNSQARALENYKTSFMIERDVQHGTFFLGWAAAAAATAAVAAAAVPAADATAVAAAAAAAVSTAVADNGICGWANG